MGVDTLGWSPGKKREKRRRSGRKHSGMISIYKKGTTLWDDQWTEKVVLL